MTKTWGKRKRDGQPYKKGSVPIGNGVGYSVESPPTQTKIRVDDIHTAEQVQEIIMWADFKMDPYARAYFDAMKRAENEAYIYGHTPEEGLKVQVLYFFSNAKARTPEQKRVKKELLAWANYRGYRGR